MSSFLAVATVQMAATGAAWLLRSHERALRKKLPYVVSLAIGVLLATALLDLMPEAVQQLGNRSLVWALLGSSMIFLFAAERVLFALSGAQAEPNLDARAHAHVHGLPNSNAANLLLASMLHSFVDGAAVAVAFLNGSRLGWLTAFAVGLHEIPHRLGDFALFVHMNVPLSRALRLAAVAGLPSVVGVAVVLAAGRESVTGVAWLLPISAGSFLYIATVNLLPELRTEANLRRVLLELGCLCAGVGIVALVGTLS